MDLFGGALLRGIALESRRWMVGSYRRASGGIVLGVAPAPRRDGVRAWPFVRGLAVFVENSFPRLSLQDWSADWAVRELEDAAADPAAPAVPHDEAPIRIERLDPAESRFVAARAPRLVVMLLFVLLVPQLVVDGVMRLVVEPPSLVTLSFQLWTALATIVLAMVYGRLVRGMTDIAQLFQYNAVFLRVLSLHERGEKLDVRRLRNEPSFNVRSGASNILLSFAIVPWVTWLVVSRAPAPSGWLATHAWLVALKLATAPIVVMLAFEVQELLATLHRVSFLRAPLRALLFLQPFFVSEPEPDQLELGLVVSRELVRLQGTGTSDIAAGEP